MILTPKEKAHELLYKFMAKRISWKQSKLCALIAIDEIIQIDGLINEDIYVEKPSYLNYWQEVKIEIQNL